MDVSDTRAQEPQRFRDGLADHMGSFLESRRQRLEAISPEAADLVSAVIALTSGGKRMRALLCYWGWRGAGGSTPALPTIIVAAAALELFQAAALIHDDIIDSSDTRRGGPSVHRRFEQNHRRQAWALGPEQFGQAAAILTGDLCLSLSEEVFASVQADRQGVTPGQIAQARQIFDAMRLEVMAGQYLDVLEEVAGPTRDREAAADRARTIIRYKSAKYSTERPLGLGGTLGGATPELLEGYAQFALPLGEAFQLQDDLLGLFGDPAQTGKPAGDDLREGKRTMLIAYALQGASTADARFLEESLGDPALNDQHIARLRRILIDSGAVAAVEDLIGECAAHSRTALATLEIDEISRSALAEIAEAAVHRST